jgi:hypothetical protein
VRRAAPGALALLVCASLPRVARADELKLKLALEAGTELDSNPKRETESYAPVPAAVGRGGIRFSLGWRPASRRTLQLSAVAAAKKFVGGSHADDEDVAVLTGDLRYDQRAASAPLVLGARLAYYDAIERGNPVADGPDHDFRTGDAALSLTLVGENAQHVGLVAGVRAFQYKPAARYDFVGEHAQLEWRKTFEPAEDADAPSWELGAWYGLARRGYDDDARADVCAPAPQVPPECLVRMPGVARVDLAHNAGAEVVYTGERIYAARYEATVSLSNSFGESLVRHRLELSATSETYFSIFVTARAVVQVNRFFDPVLLTFDIGKLTIEDENRNSINLHATRDLGTHWSVEARYAFYSNEFATQALVFRRQTAYLGLVWRL